MRHYSHHKIKIIAFQCIFFEVANSEERNFNGILYYSAVKNSDLYWNSLVKFKILLSESYIVLETRVLSLKTVKTKRSMAIVILVQ